VTLPAFRLQPVLTLTPHSRSIAAALVVEKRPFSAFAALQKRSPSRLKSSTSSTAPSSSKLQSPVGLDKQRPKSTAPARRSPGSRRRRRRRGNTKVKPSASLDKDGGVSSDSLNGDKDAKSVEVSRGAAPQTHEPALAATAAATAAAPKIGGGRDARSTAPSSTDVGPNGGSKASHLSTARATGAAFTNTDVAEHRDMVDLDLDKHDEYEMTSCSSPSGARPTSTRVPSTGPSRSAASRTDLAPRVLSRPTRIPRTLWWRLVLCEVEAKYRPPRKSGGRRARMRSRCARSASYHDMHRLSSSSSCACSSSSTLHHACPSSAKDESASPRAKVEHEAPSSFYKVGALARRTSSPALFLVLCAITVIASAFVALVWTKVEPLTRTGARPGLVEVALAMVPRACTPAGLLVGAPSSPQHDAPSLLTGHGGATVPAAALEPATLEASVFKVEFTNSALLITVAIASLALWRAPRLPVVRRAEREAEKVSITVTSASAPQTSSSRCPSH